MTEPKRYKFVDVIKYPSGHATGEVRAAVDGPYMEYADHVVTLTARDQRIAELEGETFGRLQVIEACGETMCEQQARIAELEGLLREWLNRAIHPTGDLASRTERALAQTQETRG